MGEKNNVKHVKRSFLYLFSDVSELRFMRFMREQLRELYTQHALRARTANIFLTDFAVWKENN